MGFRNPITSVSDVDTSSGAGGARIVVLPDIPVNPRAENPHGPALASYIANPAWGPGTFRTVDDWDGSGTPATLLTSLGNDLLLYLTYDPATGNGRLALVNGNPAGASGPPMIGGLGTPVAAGDAVPLSYLQKLAGLAEPNAANAGWATGWTVWNDGVYQDLGFYLTRDGMVTVNGLAKFSTGGGLKIFGITNSAYLPRGKRPILNGSVNDVPRTFEVKSDGLYLRGALPANGQFISVNGSYPGANATT